MKSGKQAWPPLLTIEPFEVRWLRFRICQILSLREEKHDLRSGYRCNFRGTFVSRSFANPNGASARSCDPAGMVYHHAKTPGGLDHFLFKENTQFGVVLDYLEGS